MGLLYIISFEPGHNLSQLLDSGWMTLDHIYKTGEPLLRKIRFASPLSVAQSLDKLSSVCISFEETNWKHTLPSALITTLGLVYTQNIHSELLDSMTWGDTLAGTWILNETHICKTIGKHLLYWNVYILLLKKQSSKFAGAII